MKNLNTKLFLLSLVVLVVFISCSQSETKAEVADGNENAQATTDNNNKALALLKTNCFNCHNPDMGGSRVAPPLFKVREHYYDEETTKEEFVAAIINFINYPTEENSIMPGAVRNFGLMPKMSFKEEDIQLMAEYLYNNDVSSDEWYAKWEEFKKSPASVQTDLSYEDLGRNIVNETKSNIGKNLMKAVKERGAAGAVEFCNTRAIPITDSMAVVLNTKVKRVSDKPRNPINAANSQEIAYIEGWRKAKANGEKYPPKVTEIENKMVGYYPIEINQTCLKCHGIPEKQINTETLANIKKSYPNDKATSYAEGEIRGIFVVEMDKK